MSSCCSEMDKSFRLFTTTICWFALKRKFMVVIQPANVSVFIYFYRFLQELSQSAWFTSMCRCQAALKREIPSCTLPALKLHLWGAITVYYTPNVFNHPYMTESSVWACGNDLMMIFPATGWKIPLYRQQSDRPV